MNKNAQTTEDKTSQEVTPKNALLGKLTQPFTLTITLTSDTDLDMVKKEISEKLAGSPMYESTIDLEAVKNVENAKTQAMQAIPAGQAFDSIRNSMSSLFDKQIKVASKGEDNMGEIVKLMVSLFGKKTRTRTMTGGKIDWTSLTDESFVVLHHIDKLWYISTLGKNLVKGKLPKDTPALTDDNQDSAFIFLAHGGSLKPVNKERAHELALVTVTESPSFTFKAIEKTPKTSASGLNLDIQRLIRGESMKDSFHVNGWASLYLPIDSAFDFMRNIPDYTKTE